MTKGKNMQKADAGGHERSENRNDCPLVVVENGRMFTTSLIVADVFGKDHKDILKGIDNLECSPAFNERNFAPVEYRDAKGEMRPAYPLTRDGFIFLSMEFTDKKATAWKEKFLEAFNATATHLLKRQTDCCGGVDFFPRPDSSFEYSPRKVRAKAQRVQAAGLFAVAHCGRKDY